MPEHEELRLRRGVRDDLPALAAMFHEAFEVDRSPESWLWRYWHPDGPEATHLVLEDEGVVVAHLGHQVHRMWVHGEPGSALYPGDTMVVPSHRGRGAFGTLVRATFDELDRVDLRVAFPKDHVSPMATNQGAGQPLGRLPQWVRWRTPAAMTSSRGSLPPAAATAIHRSLALAARAARLPLDVRRPIVERVEDLPADIDALAEASRNYAPFLRVRDERYLRWRWLDNPRGDWAVWTVRGSPGKALGGIAIAGVADLELGRTGRIVDLLAVDAASTTALLTAIAADAERQGADVVTFEYVDPRRWSRWACLAAGFLPRGVGPIVLELRTSDRARQGPSGFAAWYATFGDTDLV